MRRELFAKQGKTVRGRMARIGAAGLAVAALAGCTSAQTNNGVSPAYLVVDTLEGASGAEADKLSTLLNSDVLTNGGVLQDEGQITLHIAMKDPGTASAVTTPSPANYITLSRYHVQYTRADGRNTPGVDVPYPFDGGLGATVTGDNKVAALTLVRVQAKLEAPLRALRNLGGSVAISTIATVTVFGTDQAGREVSASANISVNFADWADPKSGGN